MKKLCAYIYADAILIALFIALFFVGSGFVSTSTFSSPSEGALAIFFGVIASGISFFHISHFFGKSVVGKRIALRHIPVGIVIAILAWMFILYNGNAGLGYLLVAIGVFSAFILPVIFILEAILTRYTNIQNRIAQALDSTLNSSPNLTAPIAVTMPTKNTFRGLGAFMLKAFVVVFVIIVVLAILFGVVFFTLPLLEKAGFTDHKGVGSDPQEILLKKIQSIFSNDTVRVL